jgi:hypothetical protein
MMLTAFQNISWTIGSMIGFVRAMKRMQTILNVVQTTSFAIGDLQEPKPSCTLMF